MPWWGYAMHDAAKKTSLESWMPSSDTEEFNYKFLGDEVPFKEEVLRPIASAANSCHILNMGSN